MGDVVTVNVMSEDISVGFGLSGLKEPAKGHDERMEYGFMGIEVRLGHSRR